MLYYLNMIVSGYRETEGLPPCPVCGNIITAESEERTVDGGSGERSVYFVQCEHCHATLHYANDRVPEELEPYCDTGQTDA